MPQTSHQAGNPFCTRYVRPGALPYLFPDGTSIETLIDRLKQNRWWGQIVGPHGSGKSTLLASLIPEIEHCNQRVVFIELHDGQRRLPRNCMPHNCEAQPTVIVVDGYEQLSHWSRWSLKQRCRRLKFGLLVTTHAAVRLPVLVRTSVSLDMAENIVAHILKRAPISFSRQEIAECLEQHGQNLRETLFDLYDRYEQRQTAQAKKIT